MPWLWSCWFFKANSCVDGERKIKIRQLIHLFSCWGSVVFLEYSSNYCKVWLISRVINKLILENLARSLKYLISFATPFHNLFCFHDFGLVQLLEYGKTFSYHKVFTHVASFVGNVVPQLCLGDLWSFMFT